MGNHAQCTFLSLRDLEAIDYSNVRDLVVARVNDLTSHAIVIFGPDKGNANLGGNGDPVRVKYAFAGSDRAFGIVANGPIPYEAVKALLTRAPRAVGSKRWVFTGGFGVINAAPTNQAYVYTKNLGTDEITGVVINFGNARGADVQFDEDEHGLFYAYGTGITGINTSTTFKAEPIDINPEPIEARTPVAAPQTRGGRMVGDFLEE